MAAITVAVALMVGIVENYQCAYNAGHPATQGEQAHDNDRATAFVQYGKRWAYNTQYYS